MPSSCPMRSTMPEQMTSSWGISYILYFKDELPALTAMTFAICFLPRDNVYDSTPVHARWQNIIAAGVCFWEKRLSKSAFGGKMNIDEQEIYRRLGRPTYPG